MSDLQSVGHQPGPLENKAATDHLFARGLVDQVKTAPDYDIENFPTQTALTDKKSALAERIARDSAVANNFRNANHETLVSVEQLKHDITQYRENLAFQEKQQIILRRERDMLEHRFKWTRSDFNIALTTSTLLREKIQEIVDSYQHEIALQSAATGDSLSKLDDTQFFYTLISQIQTKQDDLIRFNSLLKNDITVLQSILQCILDVTFDDQGLPRSNIAEVFQTLPQDEYEQLVQIAKKRLESRKNNIDLNDDIDTTVSGSTIGTITDPTITSSLSSGMIGSLTSTTSSTVAGNDPLLEASGLLGDPLQAISIMPPNLGLPQTKPVILDKNSFMSSTETAIKSITQQSSVIDSFIAKCISLTGHFQPKIFIEHLRRQSDQLLLLQRSHTLLTSQLFQLQQDKALLLAYFESFLKETASLKQLLHSSNIKVDEDARTIFALQQRNIALEQEIEFFQTDRILTLTSSQLESLNQTTLIDNANSMIEQVEKAHGALAIAHNSIYKLRTVNAQQNEQIELLQLQFNKSEKEKEDLLKIIEHLESQQQQQK